MKAPEVAVIDFETKAIRPRPKYPPRSVGVSIILPGKKPRYYAYGHPADNNCTREDAKRALKQVFKDHTVLCHNAGFDLDIAEEEFGVRWPALHHDTLLMGFLVDPDSDSLSLKPQAERYLGEPPTERDELRDWIMANVTVPATGKRPTLKGEHGWAAYISEAPGGMVGKYANGDTSRTDGLFRFHWKDVSGTRLKEAYERELKVTRTLVKMERRGVPVDVPSLERDIKIYELNRRIIEAKLLTKLKVPKRLHADILDHYEEQDHFKWSGAGFAERLISSGLVDHLPLTEKGNPSVSAESLAEVMPKKLAAEFEVRSQISTCLQTFMRPWLEMGRETGGLFFARFNQVRNGDEWGKKTGARTGRLSMTPNLQNMIRGDKDARVPRLRTYIVPGKKAKAIAKRDYSQQELRILADFEDDAYSRRYPGKIGPFRAAYEKDPTLDAHVLVKDLIRETVGMVLERRPVKDLNFGLIYGQGLNLTAEKMGVTKEEAKRARAAHSKSLPGIPILQQELKDRVRAGEPIWTWGGRRYYCEPPVFAKGRWMTFEYKMLNKLIQGSAADCTKQAMVNYDAMGDVAEENPLILQVHDELLALVANLRDEKRVHRALGEAMFDVSFNVPMLSDGSTGRKSYGDMVDVDDGSWLLREAA